GDRADVFQSAPDGRLGEQLREVLPVARTLAGEAGGAHARRAAEGRGADPRVVGDRDPGEARGRRPGLAEGVLGERLAVLGGQLEAVREDVEVDRLGG